MSLPGQTVPNGGYPMATSSKDKSDPPPYSTDILTPPSWNGPSGSLVNFDPTRSSTAQYQVMGTDSQVVQVTLQPGEQMVTEPGAMLYKSDSINMSTSLGGCAGAWKRCCGGESIFRNSYTNRGNTPACVTITPHFPAKVIPLNLSKSGTMFVHPGLYIAHLGDVNVTFKFIRSVLAGCFGGGGFLMLKLTGTGTVFLAGGGTIMEKVLQPSEKVLVDTHSVLAFSASAEYGVARVPGCLTCCCGGEGLFNTSLTGPGLVIIHSMSQNRFRQAVGYHGGGSANNDGNDAGGA